MKFRQRNVTDKLTYSNLFNQSTKMCLNEKFCMQIKTKPTPDAKINRFLAWDPDPILTGLRSQAE